MQNKLQNLIQTQSDVNFLVEDNGGYESGYDLTFSQSTNKEPSPVGRNQTSTSRIDDDVLNIKGWVRPLLHNGVVVDVSGYARRAKELIATQTYTTEVLATITNADGVFANMLLKKFTLRRDGKNPQELLVSMTWVSMNLSGSVDSPTFSIGGLV